MRKNRDGQLPSSGRPALRDPGAEGLCRALVDRFLRPKSDGACVDLPEHALRQEDSDANYYLIEGREKRRVTSGAALSRLGRRWSEVRKVPNGALAELREGVGVY